VKVKEISLIAIFVSLMAIGSQIIIPLGPIPFTMQLVVVFLSGFLLKPKNSLIVQIIYLLLGVFGVPVFSGFSGGMIHIIGPSGGFLISFPFSAFVISLCKFSKKLSDLFSGFFGLIIVYFIGWCWLGIYMTNFIQAFIVGILPFIFFDVIKLFISIYIKNLLLSNLKVFSNS
jgi:biotin transport system substrate-specific component